jgi:thioredoxin-related protein
MLEDFLGQLGVQADEEINLSNPKNDEDLMKAGMFGIAKTPHLVLVDDNGNKIDEYKGVGQTGVKRILAQRGLI